MECEVSKQHIRVLDIKKLMAAAAIEHNLTSDSEHLQAHDPRYSYAAGECDACSDCYRAGGAGYFIG